MSHHRHRKQEDFPLRVAKRHIELLNSMPDFIDLSTTQLWYALPEKYRKHVPSVGFEGNDRMTRAVLIGMLATEVQIASFMGKKFLECLY